MANPSRPQTVPQNAVWDTHFRAWVLGKTQNSKRTGEWSHWDKQGKLIFVGTYSNGELDGQVTHYHPDGRIAQQGVCVNGKQEGWFEYEKRNQNDTNNFPRVYNQRIMKARLFFHEGRTLKTFYYLADGKQVDIYARPFPQKVKKGAWWNSSSYEWEWGTVEDGKFVGDYKAWRWDGRLAREHSYNQQGQMHGLAKRYHNDGTVSRSGNYSNGKADGEHTFVRSKNYTQEYDMNSVHRRIHKKITTFINGREVSNQYFDADGKPVSRKGFAVINAEVSDLFDGKPSEFLGDNFAAFLQRFTEGKLAAANTQQTQKRQAQFEHFWGINMPDELAKTFELFEQADFPRLYNYFDTAAPKLDQLKTWEKAGKNVVEEAILHTQESFPFDYLVDWFSGSLCLDALLQHPERPYYSYSYHYGLFDQADQNKVYLHKHQGYSFWGYSLENVFAKDLSTFLYFMSMFCAYDEYEIMTLDKFSANYPQLQESIKLPYYYLNNMQVGRDRLYEGNFRYNPKERTSLTYFNRSKWILELLRGESDVHTIKYNYPNYPSIESNQLQATLDKIKTNVPEAFYFLFGTFFSKQKTYLHEIIDACKESSARIIQDAGRLVEQWQDGRKGVGIVTNLQDMQAQLHG